MSSSQQQQHERQILHVKALDEAVAILLQNNFDADSQVCLTTLMKILDNVLHKPHDDKVRRLRLSNAAVWNKVGQRKGGIEILEACGFERVTQPPPLLSDPSVTQGESLLVLNADKEDQTLLITARRLLQTRAVQDLGMDPNQLPVYREPPPPVAMANNANSNASSSFNIYAGQRYDAKSAAVGQNLGPSAGYKSKTTADLEALQRKQRALEQKMHRQPVPRQWQAFLPATAATMAATSSASGSTSGGGSDASLLAARMQKQQAEQKQREEGGFTTAAMREVQRLKQQKVYSHVTLTLQFPSGHAVRGQFLPKETIHNVMQSLQQDCLVSALQENDEPPLELYVTPPRRRLPPSSTLQQEGLVPAAKVFVSWKSGGGKVVPSTDEFLQPRLFAPPHQQPNNNNDSSFPTAQGVAEPMAVDNSGDRKPASTDNKKKKKGKSDRQDEMLKRMMGKGGL